MSQFRTLVAMLFTTAALGACTGGPEVESNFVLRMPQLSADVIFAEVTVEQAGVVQGVELAAGENTASFLVVAGEPVTVSATVFRAQTGVWEIFAATTNAVPDGVAPVEVTLAAVPGRSITVNPSFDGGEPFGGMLAMTLVDDATGLSIPISATTGMPITVPEGRSFTLMVDTPDGGMPVSIPILDAAQVGASVNAPLGMPPALPSLDVGVQNLPTYTPGTDLVAPMGFTFECTLETDCAAATMWQDCAMPLSLPQDRAFTVSVRLVEAPDLGCGTLNVELDSREPIRVEVRYEPPFLLDTDPPQVQAFVTANEPMDPASITLNGPGGDLCQSLTAISPTEVLCDADFSSLTGLQTLRVDGADAAGNPFSIPSVYSRIPAPAVDEPVQIVSIRTYPSVFRSGMFSMLVSVDVAHFGTNMACVNFVFSDTVKNPSGGDALEFSTPSFFFSAGGSFPELPPAVGSVPGIRRYWGEYTLQGSFPAMEGTYRADIVVDADDCSATPQNPMPRLEFAFDVEIPDPRWLVDVINLPRTRNSFTIVPIANAEDYGQTYSSDAPAIANIAGGDGIMVTPGTPGQATFTVTRTADGASSDVEVHVSDGPSLVSLHTTQVLIETDGNVEPAVVFDSAIGTPLRLLWDSVSDALWVVGDAGYQQIRPTVGTAQPVPCGAINIVDAALSGIAPNHARPQTDLVFLAQTSSGMRHCEVDPADGTVHLDQGLPTDCADAARILSDTVSGSFVVLGETTGCAARYHTRSGTLTELDSNNRGQPTSIVDAELDPFNGYISTVEGIVAPQLSGWFVAPGLTSVGPFDVGADVGSVAIDQVTGIPMASVEPAAAARFIRRFSDRDAGQSPGMDSGLDPVGATNDWVVMVHDSGNRVLYAYDDATPPVRWEFEFNDFTVYGDQFVDAFQAPLSITEPVVDALVIGPQAHTIQPARVIPGGMATLRGSGFAATGNEVYVLGVPAKVTSESPHFITFQVPIELEALTVELTNSSKSFDAPVHVVAHGRTNGVVAAGYQDFEVMHPSPFRQFDPFSLVGEMTCSSACPAAKLVEAPNALYGVRTSLQAESGFWELGGMFPPNPLPLGPDVGPVTSPLSLQAPGAMTATDQWILTHLPPVISTPEQQRTVPMVPPLSNVFEIALGTSANVAAVADENGVHLLNRNTLDHLYGPLAGAPANPTHLAFMPDSTTLIAMDAALAVSAWRMPLDAASAPVPATVTLDTTGCPGPIANGILAAESLWGAEPGVGVVATYTAETAIVKFVDTGTTIEGRCDQIAPEIFLHAVLFPSGEVAALYRTELTENVWDLVDLTAPAERLDEYRSSGAPYFDAIVGNREEDLVWTEGSTWSALQFSVQPL